MKIKVLKNGPYAVSGKVPLKKEVIISDDSDFSERWEAAGDFSEQESYQLCRCGNSQNKPFCDSSHLRLGFDGTETAKHDKFDDLAMDYDGPALLLKDNIKLCSSAGFCSRKGGTWKAVDGSDKTESKKLAVEEVCNCPSGRLRMYDKETNVFAEPIFAPSISATEQELNELGGPLWVKGGIPIESADGKMYEERNRVTLCRCGHSCNKPFCDGEHLKIGFKAD